MKIVTVQFQYPDFYDFTLLRDVFKKSCEIQMPDVEFVDIHIPPPVKIPGKARNFKYNSTKLEIWRDYMQTATEPIIFADCDMLCMLPAHSAFDIDFDIAFTARTRVHRIPMNGGIIFARPTENARIFFDKWLEANNKMLKNEKLHHIWRVRYAGMNQAAFGYVYHELYLKKKINLKLHEYKTIDWNAVDCDWQNVNGKTHFVHYKSRLRKFVLREQPVQHPYEIVMNAWYDVKQILYPNGRRPPTVVNNGDIEHFTGDLVHKRRNYRAKAGTRRIRR